MRRLAWAALPYAAAVFLAEYFLPVQGLPIFAAALFLIAFAGLLLHGAKRRRFMLVCFAAAVGFGWYAGHWAITGARCEPFAKQKMTITARVTDYPQFSEDYTAISIRLLDDELPSVRAVLYSYAKTPPVLEPGDIIEVNVYVTESTEFYAAKDVYLRGYIQDAVTVTGHWAHAWLYFPQRICQAIKDACDRAFPDFAAPLVKAMMTGDTADLKADGALYAAMKSCGVTHIVAVSGLHMLYLTGFIQLLLGHSRRSALACLPLVVLFVLMTGCSPSVVRAAVLQIMLLVAPLFGRESDSATSLAAALGLLLLVNPNAVASVSLQLSFAAAAGMLLLTGHIRRWFFRRVRNRAVRYIIDSFACTIGATAFSMPIAAYYFGCIPLLSAVVNLLCLPLLEGVFCAGYILSVLALVLPSAATFLAWLPTMAVWLCALLFRLTAALPFACVYTDSAAVVAWVVFSYGGFALTFIARRRGGSWRYIIPSALSISALCVVLVATGLIARSQALVTVLDVGQGESVVIFDGNACVVVDCGGKNTLSNAGETAASYIRSAGRKTVDLLVLTHLHDDHANGVEELLYNIPVRHLALSVESFDHDELLSDILAAAERCDTEVLLLAGESSMVVGGIQLALYQPLSGENENESGIVVAAEVRGVDVLVMGDMDSDGERTLVSQGRADTDILVAGHHGSKYSSSALFLHAASPMWSVVSVGDNSYGHPTDEALGRMEEYSRYVCRTDMDGNVTIRID